MVAHLLTLLMEDGERKMGFRWLDWPARMMVAGGVFGAPRRHIRFGRAGVGGARRPDPGFSRLSDDAEQFPEVHSAPTQSGSVVDPAGLAGR